MRHRRGTAPHGGDIAEPLDDHALAFQPRREAGLGDIARMVEKGPQRILRRVVASVRPAMPPLWTGLPVTQAQAFQFRRIETFVFIRHPGHFTLASADIRSRDILRGMDQIAFGEFLGETPGDPAPSRFRSGRAGR